MAKDVVTVPLSFSRAEHERLSKLKDGLGLTWEQFFLRPYEKNVGD